MHADLDQHNLYQRWPWDKALVLDNLGPLLPGLFLIKKDTEPFFKRLSGIKYTGQEVKLTEINIACFKAGRWQVKVTKCMTDSSNRNRERASYFSLHSPCIFFDFQSLLRMFLDG